MPGLPRPFAIHESRLDGHLCLSLSGELDLSSTPLLEDRLARLRAVKTPVRLDLSKLHFIDSTGVHLLIRTVGDARIKGWELRIDPDVPSEVMRVLRLARIDRFVVGP